MLNEVKDCEFKNIYNKEPNKCYGWYWTSIEELRKNILKLFHPLQDFLTRFPRIENVVDLKNMVKNFNFIKE